MHRSFWHVGSLPCLLGWFLLFLLFGLRLVFQTLFLHIFYQFCLVSLKLLNVIIFLFGYKPMQLSQWITFLGELEPLELARTSVFLKLGLVEPILLSVEVWFTTRIDCLFYFFVHMHDWETQVIPYFWISFELMRGLFEVSECLSVLFVFKERETKVV